jgi:DMSO/TMAO reductase YedYZ molybdopterin-dependent catalytic subunit
MAFTRAGQGDTGERLPDGRKRLPPGQWVTDKWPVLHVGSVPRFDPRTWDFRVGGLVGQPLRLTWDEFNALPRVERVSDVHCVTTWSRYENRWGGVATQEILARARPTPEARFVVVHAENGYTANLALKQFEGDDCLFATHHDGAPLSPEHGYPVRLVVPQLYFWKSAKWVRGIELTAEDRPGFWEVRGYSNTAEPWQEDRYS